MRLGFILHSRGIDPLIYTYVAIFILYWVSYYIKIFSVSTKFAALPSLSRPLVTNLRPGLLQSFLDIKMKSVLDLSKLGELIYTKPKTHGTLNAAYSTPLNSESRSSLKAYYGT